MEGPANYTCATKTALHRFMYTDCEAISTIARQGRAARTSRPAPSRIAAINERETARLADDQEQLAVRFRERATP